VAVKEKTRKNKEKGEAWGKREESEK